MQYKGYTGSVEIDDDYKGLRGEVIGTRDVITYEADTVPELVQAFHESVDDYLAFCKERGEAPERPFSGKFLVRLKPQLHRDIAIAAQAAGESLNAFVVKSLDMIVHGEAVREQETVIKPFKVLRTLKEAKGQQASGRRRAKPADADRIS
jgi:predicted HicB family RNase H-like nuclease